MLRTQIAGTVLHEPWVHDSSSQRQTVENKHQQPTQTTGASAEQDVPSVGDSSDDDDDAEDDDDEFLDSYRSVPVATIALDSIADILDRLYRLAFKIRHPSLRIGLSKASVYEDKDPESGIELFAASQSLDQAHVDQVLHSLRARYPKHTGKSDIVRKALE